MQNKAFLLNTTEHPAPVVAASVALQSRLILTAIASERGGDGRIDGLLNSEGWNYAVQIYEPHPEILDGACTFPEIVPMR